MIKTLPPITEAEDFARFTKDHHWSISKPAKSINNFTANAVRNGNLTTL
jgi:hypothetical protein